ncbi:hypothetical protein Taro_010633 [Colocasia esculenta]|uniref:Uncharacterized protein n=1 Tax=Colocasia esculenta TaxID=4460 RepID=A0A843UDM4_COLES|nr:hypothetical protein [Colocasia esculenta]
MAPVVAAPLLSLSRFPPPNTRPRSSSSTALPTATCALLPRYPIRFFPPFVSLPRRPTSSGDGKPQRAVQGRQQQIYVYPDPIPEFAEAETRRFQGELLKRLSKDRDAFGSDADAVVRVCSEVCLCSLAGL